MEERQEAFKSAMLVLQCGVDNFRSTWANLILTI